MSVTAGPSAPRAIALLGSTGSIGVQAIDVVGRHPGRFAITALSCRSSADDVIAQARQTGARLIGVADPAAAARVREAVPDAEVVDGPDASTIVAACGADVVVNGMVGSIGLRPTIAALKAGSSLALANKESLIVGGPLVMSLAGPDQIVPVDSEHSAIAQCLRGGEGREVARLVVTASGGPFRGRSREDLAAVTVGDALDHPTWDMGAVITINSASLANKGLEVIEAHLLFDVPMDRIDVVVHPQSIVHSMVEFVDGATVAKLSPPDMRLPIQLALTWPERLPFAPTAMDWTTAQDLTFEPPDEQTFPMLPLARRAGSAGGTAPAVYNAANEQAVTAFLDTRLTFLGIAEVVEATLGEHDPVPLESVDHVLEVEDEARRTADRLIAER